jgi:solute carrier family 25 ornithine transporter 2/15
MGPIYHAISGFFAGFFSSLTLCPTELVKCRLQAMRETTSLAGGNGAAALPDVRT